LPDISPTGGGDPRALGGTKETCQEDLKAERRSRIESLKDLLQSREYRL